MNIFGKLLAWTLPDEANVLTGAPQATSDRGIDVIAYTGDKPKSVFLMQAKAPTHGDIRVESIDAQTPQFAGIEYETFKQGLDKLAADAHAAARSRK